MPGSPTQTASHMNKKPVTRLLIADDHPVVREGLACMVNRQCDMQVVAEASDGRAAVEGFFLHRPDIVLMDVLMPNLDGISATAAIRNLYPEARIILISSYETEEHVYQGVRAGAKGYLPKGTPRNELLETIRKVHGGATCIPYTIAAKLAEHATHAQLSPREMQVLRLMVAGKSNKEIGVALCLSEGTIKVHVCKLLKKLKASGRTEAINLALTRGIVSLAA